MSPRFTDSVDAPRRLNKTTRATADKAARMRSSVEGLTGIGAGRRDRSYTVKRVGRIVLAFLLVALFGALLYFVAWKAEFIGGKTMPDVVGWRSERAVIVIQNAGFTSVTTQDVESDSVAEGMVVSTNPNPGVRADVDSNVVVEVAVAPPTE